MADLIERQEAIDALTNMKGIIYASDGVRKGISLAWNEILKLPPAQPERKKGCWLPDNNCYYETRYICSECKLPFHVETIMMKPSWRFCPNCGARMEGESE